MANSGKLAAEPGPIALDWAATALLIIDMQRDFMEPGGFGETLGNDVSQLARAVKPIASVLDAARAAGMLVVHTREGHLPDLSDAPPAKVERGAPSLRIGDPGPMGRILIRGEAGHDIIPELYPLDSEIVIDKPARARSTPPSSATCCSATASRTCWSAASPPRSASHHRAGSQRPRLSLRGAGGWLRSYFPDSTDGPEMIKAQGASRLGLRLGGGAASAFTGESKDGSSGGITMSTSATGTAGTSAFKPACGRRAMERLVRLRHQHPRQHAGADRAVALRAEDA